jgi:hypothetical protein
MHSLVFRDQESSFVLRIARLGTVVAFLSTIMSLSAPRSTADIVLASTCKVSSRAFIDTWECPDARNAVLGAAVSSDEFRVISRHHGLPYEVVEPKLHRRGVVEYGKAWLVDVNDRAGLVEVPLSSGGALYKLTWHFNGEFMQYLGVSPL